MAILKLRQNTGSICWCIDDGLSRHAPLTPFWRLPGLDQPLLDHLTNQRLGRIHRLKRKVPFLGKLD